MKLSILRFSSFVHHTLLLNYMALWFFSETSPLNKEGSCRSLKTSLQRQCLHSILLSSLWKAGFDNSFTHLGFLLPVTPHVTLCNLTKDGTEKSLFLFG